MVVLILLHEVKLGLSIAKKAGKIQAAEIKFL
jgi:hypothetical protein